MRVKQAHALEQLAARRPGERLSREHQGDLFPIRWLHAIGKLDDRHAGRIRAVPTRT